MTTMQAIGRAALFTALIFAPVMARAAPAPSGHHPGESGITRIVQSNNEVGFGLSGVYNHFSQSGAAVSSHGWLPGVTAYAVAMRDYAGVRHLYVSLRDHYAWGGVHQGGLPATGGFVHQNAAYLRLGKGFAVRSHWLLTPYVQVGDQYQDRELGPGATLSLHNRVVGGGLMIQYAVSPAVVVGVDGSLGATVDPTVNAHGIFSGADRHPASRLADAVTVTIDDRLTRHFHAFGRLGYDHRAYGLPGGVSDQQDVLLQTGVAYSF